MQLCVWSEHANALLKGRFQSLKELQVPVHNSKQHRYLMFWIISCLILHNLIIRHQEEVHGYDTDWEDELIDEGRIGGQHVDDVADVTGGDPAPNANNDPTYYGSPGQKFRLRVMRALFQAKGWQMQ